MKRLAKGWEKRQELRRAEIVEAAALLFFEKGYGRTSMDDVIASVGGSKRTLYVHFKRKEDLFAAIVSDVSSRVLGDLMFEIKGDIKPTLCMLGEHYMQVLFAKETLMLYRALVSEAPFFPELSRTFFENGPKRIVKHLTDFFEFHNKAGEYRIKEPEATANLFVGMLRSDHHLAAVLTGKSLSQTQMKKYVSHAVDTLMNGAVATKTAQAKQRKAGTM